AHPASITCTIWNVPDSVLTVFASGRTLSWNVPDESGHAMPGETGGVALIGSGRMGSFHGETVSRRLPGARLVAIADPGPGADKQIADEVGGDHAETGA